MDCINEEAERLDKILNNSYNKIMKSSIKKQEKEKIKSMQKTWLSYRKQFGEVLWNNKYERNSWSSTISSSMTEILRRQAIEMLNLEKMVIKRTGK